MTIVGIDEVGRGCWAGPLTVAAVALGDTTIAGLNDSKLVSKAKRPKLAAEVRLHADGIGIGWVSAKQIDSLGLSKALKLAAAQAVSQITVPHDEIIIDGTVKLIDRPNVTLLKKADQLIPAVSAASIVAKVARDQYMQQVDRLFPNYGFAGHVGYGTSAHSAALEIHGPSPLHRMSFAPLATLTQQPTKPVKQSAGAKAEEIAAKFLQKSGFEIIGRNWKTRWCEIDIIARRHNTIYFVEVKYRKSRSAGDGLEYVTHRKQKQMHFAARMWQHYNRLSLKDEMKFKLTAIAVEGDDLRAGELVELV